MQIEEEKGDQITAISLSLIRDLSKYATGSRETESNYAILFLSK